MIVPNDCIRCIVAPESKSGYTDRMNWLGWSLLSAFFAAITALLAKLGVETLHSSIATAIRTTVVLVLTWMIAGVTTHATDWTGISRKALLFLILSGLATGASWLCYFRSLQLGEISKVASVDKLSLVFTAVLALLVLGEKLGVREWSGLGLVVAGVILIAGK